jgi:Mlc titration factor MtfA (ptsG expression regulator)
VNFVGAGIEIVEEIKVAVGGWAILPVLYRPLGLNWYSNIERVSIYPGNSVSSTALGQMASGHFYCQVHLAWGDIRDSATKASDERNTILHEFAHVLDHLDRVVDGKPALLLNNDERKRWEMTFCPGYIFDRTPEKREQLWDFFGLGAWNEFDTNDDSCVDIGEMFAVSSEMFFESPNKLQKTTPEIYENLVMLYRLDPLIDFPAKHTATKIMNRVKLALTRQRW